ncbi:hypothetical protein GGD68_006955 [Paraburkholderia fungorum]|uniref:hypothetical protein n=1 Tax=Paraburkholderia fungorum TaxID=134537 RepID=UPI00160F9CAF|nr:hypothetical protein [Paraburkholderia fungorum]MBB4518149.1 hypothetical protein [Paraburkholderia fungorum]
MAVDWWARAIGAAGIAMGLWNIIRNHWVERTIVRVYLGTNDYDGGAALGVTNRSRHEVTISAGGSINRVGTLVFWGTDETPTTPSLPIRIGARDRIWINLCPQRDSDYAAQLNWQNGAFIVTSTGNSALDARGISIKASLKARVQIRALKRF